MNNYYPDLANYSLALLVLLFTGGLAKMGPATVYSGLWTRFDTTEIESGRAGMQTGALNG